MQIEDAKLIVVATRYLPPEMRSKDRVLILLVQPVIYIEEEEKEQRKGGKGARE